MKNDWCCCPLLKWTKKFTLNRSNKDFFFKIQSVQTSKSFLRYKLPIQLEEKKHLNNHQVKEIKRKEKVLKQLSSFKSTWRKIQINSTSRKTSFPSLQHSWGLLRPSRDHKICWNSFFFDHKICWIFFFSIIKFVDYKLFFHFLAYNATKTWNEMAKKKLMSRSDIFSRDTDRVPKDETDHQWIVSGQIVDFAKVDQS